LPDDGFLSLGLISLGLISLGLISLGLISLGLISLGLISLGLIKSRDLVKFFKTIRSLKSSGTRRSQSTDIQ
jgi:hypothetical protein